MRHFVQYHNPDKYGPFRPSKDKFGIITNKRVDSLKGDTVWLVSRRGNPPEYVLCETFVVERVGKGPPGSLQNFAKASHGRSFDPPEKIDHEPWFKRLRRLTQNFRFGLTHVQDEQVIEGLLKAISQP